MKLKLYFLLNLCITLQYFGGLRGQGGDQNLTVEVDKEDVKRMRELLRESREGLGFIDAQIFGRVEEEKEGNVSEIVEESTKSDEKVAKSSEKASETFEMTQDEKVDLLTMMQRTSEVVKRTTEKVQKGENGKEKVEKAPETLRISKMQTRLKERTDSVEEIPDRPSEEVIKDIYMKKRQKRKPSDRAYVPVKNRYVYRMMELFHNEGSKHDNLLRLDFIRRVGLGVMDQSCTTSEYGISVPSNTYNG